VSEIDAIKVISDALDLLNAEERARVLVWAQSKYASTPPSPATRPASTAGIPSPSPQTRPSKPSKKAKTVISMDKTLNLSPQGKQSAAQFANAKAPSNGREKCVVAAYYLRDMIGLEKVTAQAVFTFFKHVQWPAPADMKNMLQQAGTAGWLDTASSEDIKLTSAGENLVEHSLPAKKKA
jgi:hypothetical protein